MSLSINPLAQLVGAASQAVAKATAEAQAAIGNAAAKQNLDAKISQLSGELSSGLNGMTAGGIGAKLGAIGGEISTAFGGLAGGASSIAGKINSLQSVSGSISNITADISGTLNKLAGGSLAGGIQSLAGSISGAAGMLNNILSLKRGANLPAGGELFLKQGSAISLNPGLKDDWRVRINCEWSIFNSPLFTLLQETGGVIWPYNPNITVSTKAEYTQISTVHSNYNSYGYKNSTVDDITISGEFTCETDADAAYWIAATTFFKTATKMFFGQGDLAGNPPIICNLSGYGSSVFDHVPVIIKTFTVDLKDDVNYVKCTAFGANTWVPVVSTITVTVAPIYNRRKLRDFSLEQYAAGTMTINGQGYI